MSDDHDDDHRWTTPGENLAKEWKADPWESSLWDALESGETNPNAALEKMMVLASKDSPLSMFYLGEYYIYGRHGTKPDPIKAEHWLRKAASYGSIEGSWLLARHLEGAGKYKEAETEYNKLVDLGYSPAFFALGFEHYKGDWLERDIQKAIEHLEKAEKLGHFRAGHLLWYIFVHEKLGVIYKLRGWIKRYTMLISYALCRVNYPTSDRLRG